MKRRAPFDLFFAVFRHFLELARPLQSIRQAGSTGIANGKNAKVQEEEMVKFDAIDMQRFAVSALGALALTAVSIVAAASPAKAASVETVAKGQIIEFAAK